jgi:predicted metal-dependent hydrolase
MVMAAFELRHGTGAVERRSCRAFQAADWPKFQARWEPRSTWTWALQLNPVSNVDFGGFARQKSGGLQAALFKLHIEDRTFPVHFVRNPKARRYILRMQRGGTARVTIPRGGSLEYALRFAEKNKAWIERQVAKATVVWSVGTVLLFRGQPTEILVSGDRAKFGCIDCQAGPDLRANLEAALRAAAEPELVTRTYELAGAHGVAIRAVRVRGQRTRWGSCSSKGTICLNWRLIQTPEFVRDYIIVHELMHLREMNHSPRFWKQVEAAFPSYREAERWLRRNAGLLR